MEKKNKLILAVIAVVIVAAVVIAAVCSKPDDKKNNITDTAAVQATEEPEVTPTFVYFVSQNDENYADAMAVLEKLEAEYNGVINFDIRDYDADPSIAENFEIVVGNTPALIMHDKHNNICAFLFKNADEEALRAEIEKALGE